MRVLGGSESQHIVTFEDDPHRWAVVLRLRGDMLHRVEVKSPVDENGKSLKATVGGGAVRVVYDLMPARRLNVDQVPRVAFCFVELAIGKTAVTHGATSVASELELVDCVYADNLDGVF